jgi:hypothetical protein
MIRVLEMANPGAHDKGRFQGPIGLSCLLFKESRCVIDYGADDNDISLHMLDENKMRTHILDCVVALRRVQKEKSIKKISSGDEDHESAKNRVFTAAITMIMDDSESVDADPVLISLLAPFPDKEKMTDGRSWLSLHLALALGDKVDEKDVHLLYSQNPLVLQRYHLKACR